MSGTRVLAQVSKVVAVVSELALLTFIGAVTCVVSTYLLIPWSPKPAEPSLFWGLIICAAVLPVVVRQRLPVTALLASAVFFGLYPEICVSVAVVSYSVAGRVRAVRRRTAALFVAALIPFTIAVIGSGYQWESAFVLFGVAALVCVAGPVVARSMLDQRERLEGALRAQAGYAASAARLHERSRIAQEMHDLLGHRLSLISLYAGGLENNAVEPLRITEPARLIRGTAATAMDELRTTLGILRQPEPATTQPADLTGTLADVTQLVRQAQAGGLRVALNWSGADLADVAMPIRQAVHRIVREGVTNVSRHAPGASAEVVVEHSDDTVRVSVSDDGPVPVGPPGIGLGLAGVRERVRLLGGTCHAGALPGRGFRVFAEFPLVITQPASIEPDSGAAEPNGSWWARAGVPAVLAIWFIGTGAILVVTFGTVPLDYPAVDSFDYLRLGSTRAEVTDVIGLDDDLVARRAARGIEPEPPHDADCLYWYLPGDGASVIERYCMKHDILVDKIRFEVPGA